PSKLFPLHSTFVHIGKTGGKTVEALLKESKITVSGPAVSCSPRFQVCQVHSRPLTVEEIQGGGPVFITVRDPLARSLSAFNWRNPRDGAEHLRDRNLSGTLEGRMFDCFDQIDALALALDSGTPCGAIARGALSPGKDAHHLSMGFAYYLQGVLERLTSERDAQGVPVRRYELVRTETLLEDMRRVMPWAARTQLRADLLSNEHLFGEYPGKNKTYLSPRGRELLRTHLASEYVIMRRLEAYASLATRINFSSSEVVNRSVRTGASALHVGNIAERPRPQPEQRKSKE
ncbi:MAG: hypothetical protein SGPRY_014098, partial [Prymnesium sp.]